MRALLAAFGFLTILPVPAGIHRDRRALGLAPRFYPLVGAVVGVAAFAAFHLVEGAPALVRAVILALIPVILTRALHVDGLADAFDGLLAAGGPARRRAIMRDPRLGTFGVLAVAFDLLSRVALYASLTPLTAAALVAAPLLGRLNLLFALALVPYAESGRLKAAGNVRGTAGTALTLLWPVAFCVIWPGSLALLALSAAATAALAWLWVAFVRRHLGAISGDTLGALNELTEILVLVVFLALT